MSEIAVSRTPEFGSLSELPDLFRIGIIVQDCDAHEPSVSAIGHIVSHCKVTFVCVIDEDESIDRAMDWMKRYKIVETEKCEDFDLQFGKAGFDAILASNVQAVYIIVPTELHTGFTVPSLEAGKHVLLKDPISTPYDSFVIQLKTAKRSRRFIQFFTMFMQYHHVKSFLDVINFHFSDIESIDATFTLSYDDLEKVGVAWPLETGAGCIRRLGRYCVLLSVLLLIRHGSKPTHVKVLKVETTDDTGQPLNADCAVYFTENRVLTFKVAYTIAPTRQILEVRTHDRYATMTDFVLPHPDGLATYRMYDKECNTETGKLEVVRGEALDVPSGPPQDVMMWRWFRQYCLAVEKAGWEPNEASPREAKEALELTNVALQLKLVLAALDQSYLTREAVPVVIENVLL